MARGRRTNPTVVKAVAALYKDFTVRELMDLLQLPKRTAYDLVRAAREREAQEETDRQERERQEAERLASERLEQERREAEIALNLRREHSMFDEVRRHPHGRFVY